MLTWIKTYFRSPNIYILKYGEEINTKEWPSYCDYYRDLFTKNKKIKIVFNALELKKISGEQMWKKIRLMKSMRVVHQDYLICFCLIINNPIIYKIINFSFKIAPPPIPYLITNCTDIGLDYVDNFMVEQ